MTTAADVINVAARDIGYVEGPNNDSKFGAWYGLNHQPYCAMGVSFWFFTAGLALPATTPRGFAYCPYGVNWFRKQGRFDRSARIGDVVFFDWERNGVSDHVGLVTAVRDGGQIVDTIEANTSPDNRGSQSNGGGVYRRSRGLSNIQGFGHPAYSSTPTRPGMAPAWPGRFLALTSPLLRGDDVLMWQRQMRSRGWRIDPDGVYGERSRGVCSSFQAEKHLTRDGVVGPATWTAAWGAPVT